MGASPITYADIWFFCDLEGIRMQSWEINLIERFDIVALEEWSKQTKESSKDSSKKK